MGSGKRASMREGPLAALFRKTETEGLEGERRAPEQRERQQEPRPRASTPETPPRIPTPQERLRHAFSSDLPENMMSPPPRPAAGPRRYYPPPPEAVGSPQLRVVGVGGAGVNAVNRMIEAEVAGVDFVAVNTDAQSLQQSDADHTLQIGADLTRGLGSGSDPERGRDAAMEDYDRIKALLKGSDMVFITAGAGRRHRHRRRARRGADRPRARRADRRDRDQAVRLRGLAPRAGRRGGHPGARRRGRHADRRAEQPAAVGARQADVDGRGVPRRRRRAAPGRPGHLRPDHAAGPDQPRLRRRADDHVRRRARRCSASAWARARSARSTRPRRPSPRRCSRRRSRARKSILLSITGGSDLSLWEVNEAAQAVAEAAHPDANIIFGAMVDDKLEEQVWITVVATGYGDKREPRAERAQARACASRRASRASAA